MTALTANIEAALKEKLAELMAQAESKGLGGICIKAEISTWKADEPVQWFAYVSSPSLSGPSIGLTATDLDATFDEACRRVLWDQAAKMKQIAAPAAEAVS